MRACLQFLPLPKGHLIIYAYKRGGPTRCNDEIPIVGHSLCYDRRFIIRILCHVFSYHSVVCSTLSSFLIVSICTVLRPLDATVLENACSQTGERVSKSRAAPHV